MKKTTSALFVTKKSLSSLAVQQIYLTEHEWSEALYYVLHVMYIQLKIEETILKVLLKEFLNPLRNNLGNPLRNNLGNPLRNNLGNPLKNPLRNNLGNPLKNPLRNNLENPLRNK